IDVVTYLPGEPIGRGRVRYHRIPRMPELVKGLVAVPWLALVNRADLILIPMDAAGWSAGKPTITILHDFPELIDNASPVREKPRVLIDALKAYCRSRNLRRSSIVVCNSDFVRREAARVLRLEPKKLRLGYCGVDLRFYRPTTARAVA